MPPKAQPPKAPPKRMLSVPTVVITVVGMTVAGVLLIRLLDRPVVDPRTVEFSMRITDKDVEEWVLTCEGLLEQRKERKFAYRARTLSEFLREARAKRRVWEKKLDLTGMTYDHFLNVCSAIRFARSALYFHDQQRKQAERMAKELRDAKLPRSPDGRHDPPPITPPKVDPPKFKPGAQQDTVKVYQAHKERIEKILTLLELKVR